MPRIRLPVLKPADRVRVPPWPSARTTVPQATVIDHDDATGEMYVRSYVEKYTMGPDDPYYQSARHTVTVFCRSLLGYAVALTACHHYCKRPCVDHMTQLSEAGWSTDTVSPPPAEGRYAGKKRKAGSTDDGNA